MHDQTHRPARNAARASRLASWCCELVLVVLLAAASPAFANDAPGYEIAPVPAWVLPSTPGEATEAHLKQSSEGVSYLLVDSQVLAQRNERMRYYRYVSRALNAKGVESVGNLSIDFDPDWQRVQLHAIRVVRDGRVIDKLAGARIEVIQQEKELDELIYNGSKTVKVFLKDVRPGDVVDYSYSTIGRNPVFAGFEFGSTDLQWGVPVARLRARLLVPDTVALEVRTRNSTVQPEVSEHEGMRDYRWDFEYTVPLSVEKGAPDWYAPYVEAEWSEYHDWATVSAWAQPLYQVPARLGPALEAEARRIERAEKSPTGRMLAVLRFVQQEVRYLGVETGRNTHAPNPPDLVWERRFGDCKDKVLLTMTLLHRLGVDAYPALVNTTQRRGIASRLPNPAAFDHVIVQARIGARVWWLDPTRPMQESDAEHLYQPDYGFSLVVSPQARGLVPMKNTGSLSRREVHVQFDARNQFTGPVGFKVVTVYEGGAAEAQRDELVDSSLESLQQDYLRYYADSYPGIRLAAPMRVADDKRLNRLTTTESYSIANIAGDPGPDGKHTVWIETPDVDELLSDPEVKLRKSPLLLKYPLEVSSTTEVLLPEGWPITESDQRVDDPAFSFHRRVKADKDSRRVVIQDDYRSLSDEVSARAMPRYTANLAKARGELGYSLSWTDALPPPAHGRGAPGRWRFGRSPELAAAALAAVALAVFTRPGAARLALRSGAARRRRTGTCRHGRLAAAVHAGGAGVAGAPAWLLWQSSGAYSNATWGSVALFGGANYHALYAPVLLFELLCQLGLLVATLLCAAPVLRAPQQLSAPGRGGVRGACAWQAIDLLLASALPGPAQSVAIRRPRAFPLVARAVRLLLLRAACAATFRARRAARDAPASRGTARACLLPVPAQPA
jgi:hypothetical protein